MQVGQAANQALIVTLSFVYERISPTTEVVFAAEFQSWMAVLQKIMFCKLYFK